jgi:hypothetical protein
MVATMTLATSSGRPRRFSSRYDRSSRKLSISQPMPESPPVTTVS